MGEFNVSCLVYLMFVWMTMALCVTSHDYREALSKTLMFFEGQRSGKLPSSQRLTWRQDSALHDGSDIGMDLVGGYYDAGDNVKFHFPMAFTITMLSWSVLEFGESMGPELPHALEAIRWGTDYFLKATSDPNKVVAQVGEPNGDHSCWQRPEDMDTPRTAYFLDKDHPGSEVSAEIAAALASSSIVFQARDKNYSQWLLSRAISVFEFADKYRGSYNISLGPYVCPFYCDFNGYMDELIWGAAWLFKATKNWYKYFNYVIQNTQSLGTMVEFGWDGKHAGIYVLFSEFVSSGWQKGYADLFFPKANELLCSLLPNSPSHKVTYTKGGLFVKPGGPDLQYTTSLSFLLLVYARHLNNVDQVVQCGNYAATPADIIKFVKTQVDYILGDNPIGMSYLVGYGDKYPRKIHHRGSSLPSIKSHPAHFACRDGTPYFFSPNPNPNVLYGAITGGPDSNDQFYDNRSDVAHSEPTTYNVAPLAGLLAYFDGEANSIKKHDV